jgi:hypothetical protein
MFRRGFSLQVLLLDLTNRSLKNLNVCLRSRPRHNSIDCTRGGSMQLLTSNVLFRNLRVELFSS